MEAYEIKALARGLDRQRRVLAPELWHTLFADVERLRAVEWSGRGESCPDCRRSKRYGHQCSCPVRLALKYLGKAAAQGQAEAQAKAGEGDALGAV